METFKGIIFENRAEFTAFEGLICSYYKTKYNIDNPNACWSSGIDSLDDDKVLMTVDERVLDYPSYGVNEIVDVEKNSVKWFNQETPL